ncbi:hypothetical protein AgCh_001538 [Apium graveolens]
MNNQLHRFKNYKYQVVALSGRDSEFEIDQDKAREALKKLDQQLQSISDKPVTPPKIRGSDKVKTEEEADLVVIRERRVDWIPVAEEDVVSKSAERKSEI